MSNKEYDKLMEQIKYDCNEVFKKQLNQTQEEKLISFKEGLKQYLEGVGNEYFNYPSDYEIFVEQGERLNTFEVTINMKYD